MRFRQAAHDWHCERVYEYVRRIEKACVLPLAPKYLRVELTNHCNYRCCMCRNHKLRRPKGFMEWDVFERIMTQAQVLRIKDIQLSFYGESLLHPQLIKMVEAAVQAGFNTYIGTNGSLLDETRSKALLQAGLGHLDISIIGFQSATYAALMQGGQLASVQNNIWRLIQLRDSLAAKTKIRIHLLELREVADEMPQSIAFWREAADEVSSSSVLNYPGSPRHLDTWQPRSTACGFLWSGMVVLWNGVTVHSLEAQRPEKLIEVN
jgi:MoaA/NifB/PqqE/SkfB family radical SAM enzyme